MPTSNIVNLDPLRKLLRDNKSAIKKALELFVETTVEDMAMLGVYIMDKKMLDASRIAHSLKTRFVYLGSDDAILKVRTLEAMLKDGRISTFEEIKHLYTVLNEMIAICLDELKLEIESLSD